MRPRTYPLAEIGNRFGALIVIGYSASRYGDALQPIVLCDCGRKFQTKNYKLQRITRCPQCRSEARKILCCDSHTLEMWRSRWNGMLRRCYNKDKHNYESYGGRGIRVCKRWHSFVNFAKDISRLPGYDLADVLGLELDRINPDKNYTPTNVRLISIEENRHQRRGIIEKRSFAELLDYPDLEPQNARRY